MNHTVEFWGGQRHSINFKPDYVDSKGYYDSTLGQIAIKRMGIKGWKLQTDGNLTYYFDPAVPNQIRDDLLIKEAQRLVTDLMDALAFWKQFADTFKEYNQSKS